jgi:hypothetical protein
VEREKRMGAFYAGLGAAAQVQSELVVVRRAFAEFSG